MKAVFWIAVALLCGAMALFGFENGQEVSVTLFGTVYHAVQVKYVAFAALLVGVTFTGLVAILEGASLRLANRRLGREIARLETELNVLRTQPAPPETAVPAGAASGDTPAPSRRPAGPKKPARAPLPPSAPVYAPGDGASSERDGA